MNSESYQKKSEEIENETGVKIPKSTLYYYHENRSDEYFDYLETLQFKKIMELKIKPSGTFCYDEQYVFINKILNIKLSKKNRKRHRKHIKPFHTHGNTNNNTVENYYRTTLPRSQKEYIYIYIEREHEKDYKEK